MVEIKDYGTVKVFAKAKAVTGGLIIGDKAFKAELVSEEDIKKKSEK
jgi:hypothetical protein